MNKRNFFKLITLILAVVVNLCFVSCSSSGDGDGQGDISLDSYIIGSWHSFKGTVYANGQSQSVNITKTGEYSSAYYEIVFQNGGQAIFKGWQSDNNGLTKWMEESCRYTIKNDVVTLIDSNGESLGLLFDYGDRTLCIRAVINRDTQATVNVYLRK